MKKPFITLTIGESIFYVLGLIWIGFIIRGIIYGC